MLRQTILRRLVLTNWLVWATCGLLPASQPVGIILEADGQGRIQRSGNAVLIPALPGGELLPGDVILKPAGKLTFAFCPTKQILTLKPVTSIRVEAAALARGEEINSESKVEVCELPELPSPVEARQGTRRSPRAGDPENPKLLVIDKDLAKASNTPELLRRIARAQRLYAAGLLEESVAEYDAIAAGWRGASWASDLTWPILQASERAAASRGFVIKPEAEEFTGKTYALVIGVSRYQRDSGIQWLQYADADAEAFAAFLESERGGRLRLCAAGQTLDCEIELLENERATLAAVSDAFDRFIGAHASAEDRLFIFVAAHGVDPALEQNPNTRQTVSKQPVILTYDSSYSDVKVTGYPMSEIRDHAAQAALEYKSVVVFADVCRAYGIGGIPWSSDLQPAVQQQLRKSGIGYFMASSANEESWESFAFGGGHGAFSYAVLKGLSRTDLPAGQPIRYVNLKRDVEDVVGELTNNAQTPQANFPQPRLVLVPDPTLPAIELKPASPLTKASATRRPNPRGARPSAPKTVEQRRVDEADAISKGHLRPNEPDNAWQVLERMRSESSTEEKVADAYAARLRVALEDRGQQALIKYLKGDEIEPRVESFTRCADDFGAAIKLGGAFPFDRSREIFCEARALMFQKDTGSFERAEELLLESIRLDSKRSYAYNALGIAYLEQAAKDSRYYALAEAALHEAIRYAPYWPYPWHNLALVSTEEGKYDQAIQQYQQAMEIEPSFSYLPYNLGLLYQRLNRPSEAQQSYKKALLLAQTARANHILNDVDGRRPQESAAENALGALAASKSFRGKEAEKHYREAKALDPANIAPRHNLAVLLTSSVKRPIPEAEDLWRGILAQDPGHLPALLAFSRYYVKIGDSAQSVREYRELLNRYPDFGVARRELAGALLKADEFKEALAELRQLRDASSEDAELFERIGDSAASAQDNPTAVEALQRALDLTKLTARKASANRIANKLEKLR